MWVVELHRIKSLERLETLLEEYFKKEKTNVSSELMLQEYNGHLFFSINDISKVAVETCFGDWIVATIDN